MTVKIVTDSLSDIPSEKAKETLDAKSGLPEDILGIESIYEIKDKDIIESSQIWRGARELEAEEEKSPADLELEISPEALEAQELADDSIRMYLHQIGRVHLLSDEDT